MEAGLPTCPAHPACSLLPLPHVLLSQMFKTGVQEQGDKTKSALSGDKIAREGEW